MSTRSDTSRPVPAGAAVKVRLAGTRRGCAEATARLHRLFYVTSVSEPYPEAGTSRLVRVYVKVRLDQRPAPPPGPRPEARS